MMSNTLKNYALAVEAGNLENVSATFSPVVKVMPPAGNIPVEGKQKASMMLSAAATAIDNFKLVRTFEAESGWCGVLFEGSVDGTAVQLIDQLHVTEEDLIDQVDVFLRPTSITESLLEKMAAEIKKRSAQ